MGLLQGTQALLWVPEDEHALNRLLHSFLRLELTKRPAALMFVDPPPLYLGGYGAPTDHGSLALAAATGEVEPGGAGHCFPVLLFDLVTSITHGTPSQRCQGLALLSLRH